jgi:hypothetical protein
VIEDEEALLAVQDWVVVSEALLFRTSLNASRTEMLDFRRACFAGGREGS